MKATRPGMIWVHRLLVAMALVWSTASAQDATPPSAEPSTSAIATSDVAARADADEQLADSVQRRVQGLASNESFAERLKALTASRDRLKTALRPVQLSALPLRRLESLERHWQFLLREMERWRADIQRAIKPLSTEAEALAGKRAEWQATLTAADAAASPWSVRARQVLRRLDAAEATLTAPSAALLRLSHSAGPLGNDIEGGLEGTRAQLRLKDRQLLRLDAPPIWQTQELAQQANRASVHREGLAIESAFAADYDSKYRRGIDTMTLSMLLLLPLLIWISRRTRARARREHVPEATLAVLSRPFAAWIVLYALTWMLFNWDGPVLRHEVTLLIAWLPVLRLLPTVLRRAMGPWAWISAVFYALNFAVSLLAADALIYRYALLALSVALIATLLLLAQRRRRAMEPSRARTRTLWLLNGSAVLATIALVAVVLGNVTLATVLLDGLLDATYLAVALAAAATVIAALSEVALRRGAMVMPQPVTARAGALRRAAITLGGGVVAVLWLLSTLAAFRILEPLNQAARIVLDFRASFGDVSISVGNIVLFGVAAWAVLWISATIRNLLAEDVLPNMALPRGVAHSVSRLSYYALATLGLLFALAIAGFHLQQLAIVLGALGVGIGLGLQDVVKNFVSGLILMVERPIQPGDVVEINGVTGRVRDIGLRATRLITFEGADVVVPNGMLLSDRLTNWTLSNSSRRIEVNVGVAYNSDPQQVLALLRDVAARTDGLLAEPAAAALFVGFGANALDFTLRAWTRDDSDWVAIRSNMGLSVFAALREAGVLIPFPQQDLHLRSMSPELLALLAQDRKPTTTDAPSP